MAAAIPMAGTPDGGGRHRDSMERTPPGRLVAFPGELCVIMRRQRQQRGGASAPP